MIGGLGFWLPQWREGRGDHAAAEPYRAMIGGLGFWLPQWREGRGDHAAAEPYRAMIGGLGFWLPQWREGRGDRCISKLSTRIHVVSPRFGVGQDLPRKTNARFAVNARINRQNSLVWP